MIKRKRWSTVQPSCSPATDHATTFLVTQHLSLLHMNLKQVFIKQDVKSQLNSYHGSVMFTCGTTYSTKVCKQADDDDGF